MQRLNGLAMGVALACAPAAWAGVNPAVSLNAGSTSGMPGDSVEISVTLQILASPAPAVVATSNHLSFDADTPIAARSDGKPDCTVNPSIDKEASDFGFVPDGCSGATCTGIEALVLSATNAAAIPDGAELYTCRIAIAADAAPGAYAITNAFDSALDATQRHFAGIGTDGGVTVGGSLPTCVGDCSGNEIVTIDELLVGINLALGVTAVATCASFDPSRNGAVGIDELLQGVDNALHGCPFHPELRLDRRG